MRLGPGNRIDAVQRVPAEGDDVIRKTGDGSPFDLLPRDGGTGWLRARGAAVEPPPPMPAAFPVAFPHPHIAADEVTDRCKVMFPVTGEPGGSAAFATDNRDFPPGRGDQSIELGAVEESVPENDSDDDHPFPIHLNLFQIAETDGRMIPPRTWMERCRCRPGAFVHRGGRPCAPASSASSASLSRSRRHRADAARFPATGCQRTSRPRAANCALTRSSMARPGGSACASG